MARSSAQNSSGTNSPDSGAPSSDPPSSEQFTATIVVNGQTKEVNLADLSQRVYALFQQELRVERERIGQVR